MRVEEMITDERSFQLVNKFSLSAPNKMYKNSMENMHTDVGV